MPKAEGRVYPYVGEEYIRRDFLETIPFEETSELITIETKEFTAVCPFSGLPDIGYMRIEYYPEGKKIVELKSLKYYLISFRNVGVYQERACQIIYEDLKNLLQTDRLKVTLEYNIRGGIKTTTVLGNL